MLYVSGIDFGEVGFFSLPLALLKPKVYVFENAEDFQANVRRIVPVRRVPFFIGAKYNGLARLYFPNQMRFNLNEEDEKPDLSDMTGYFPVSLDPAVSSSGCLFGLDDEARDYLKKNKQVAVRHSHVVFNPRDGICTLADYSLPDTENRDRFNGDTNFDLPDHTGFA